VTVTDVQAHTEFAVLDGGHGEGDVSKQKLRPDPLTALDRRARSCSRWRDKVNFLHSRRAQEWATRNEYSMYVV
jgi:hypothetical protein